MGWRKRVGVTLAVVVALGVGYEVADAYDVVPGPLTLTEASPSPAPFPSAPGAVRVPKPTAPLTALDANAAEPSADVLQSQVNSLVRRSGLGTKTSVVVSDIATGTVLASSNAGAQITPASTQKLLTAAAALTSPGPQTVLTTKAVQVNDGTVSLVGGGDMMLSAGAGNPTAVNGRAGLGDLARTTAAQLKLHGVKKVALQLDDTLFTGPAKSPYWENGDLASGYVAPVSAVAINVAKLTDEEYAQRQSDPAMAAADAFAAGLRSNGVEVDATAIERAKAPAGAKVLARVESAPLSDVVDYFLQHSDNTITEVVGRLVALEAGLPGTFDGATEAVRASVEKLGVDLTGAVLRDCSGLGRGSTLSAEQLDKVVLLLTDAGHPALRSAAVGMPIAGLRGTLDTRYLDAAGRGVVRAKTGSLPGVVSLAGYVVTADGRTLAFTLMTDGFASGGSARARLVFDSFVSSLAECGCRT